MVLNFLAPRRAPERQIKEPKHIEGRHQRRKVSNQP